MKTILALLFFFAIMIIGAQSALAQIIDIPNPLGPGAGRQDRHLAFGNRFCYSGDSYFVGGAGFYDQRRQ